MKLFSSNLLSELESKLKEIQIQHQNPIECAACSIKISIKTLEKLKTFFNTYEFQNKADEIEFFKNIKPEFASKLIYFNEIYNIELAKPTCSKKVVRKYYKNQQLKLKEFYIENIELYKYYRSQNTALDKKYFIRRRHDIKLTLDSTYFQSDYNFSTSHDYKIAKIKANENLQKFLAEKIHQLQNKEIQVQPKCNLKWTGTRVALIELMYALNTAGVFNNGMQSLNELAKNFEIIFNIELGQFTRSFQEIKSRKSIEKTNFLNMLQTKLLERIEHSDEK